MKLMPALFTLFLCAPLTQAMDTEKLDKYMDALEGKFMGSISVSKNGNLIYQKTMGYADIGSQTKALKDTQYRIGSISKTFTAALVLKAVEEKKITLDKTIESYFPSIKNANTITVHHLLSHRSGIYNFTNNPDYLGWHTSPKSEQQMVALIARGESIFTPGSKADYSNSNYVLLSYILEKIYQKPYAAILDEKIVKPLGLKDTRMSTDKAPQENKTFSYKLTDTWEIEKETHPSILMGAGGILSTPTNLTLFAEGLFNNKIINASSLKQMTSIKDNYGLGLFVLPFYDKKSFGHNGGVDGFSSVFSYFPQDGIAFAITSNGTGYDMNAISLAVLSSAYNKPFDLPDFKTISLTSDDLTPYLGIYSSKQMPLKITISRNNNVLVAQATGQSSFELNATEKHIFKFDMAGIVLIFNPAKNQMTLKQGGGVFTFSKEN